jgi:hypothetical protein
MIESMANQCFSDLQVIIKVTEVSVMGEANNVGKYIKVIPQGLVCLSAGTEGGP